MTKLLRRSTSLVLNLAVSFAAGAEGLRAYVGTYTGGKSKGIYVLDFNPTTGDVSEPRLAVEVSSPSFLAIHPNGKYLYAVSESGKQGIISAFAINDDGSLKPLDHQTSGGSGPCFVSVDPSGHVAMLANYGSGSFESLPIEEDGSLGKPNGFIQDKGKSVNPSRQEGPHSHSINADPAGKFAFGCDLGLDEVIRFKLNPGIEPDGKTDVTPGVGPRHLVFHPKGTSVYVVNEMGSNVTAFHYDPATGAMTDPQTVSTLPPDFHGNNTGAEVQIHPSGKFVYASNRGDDSIAVFAVDDASGKLTALGQVKTGGKTPRNFRLDPSGAWLFAANQDSGTITVFKVNPTTGMPVPTGKTIEIAMPVCVKFVGRNETK